MKRNLIILSIGLFSSCYYNAAERNKISFKDKIDNVEVALSKMEALIKKLPSNQDFNINYEIKDNFIEVNNGPGRGDSASYYTNRALRVLTASESKQFVELAKYLKRNNITAGYLYSNSSLCLFTYKENPEDTFDDLREITFSKDSNNSIVKEEYKILDRTDIVILVAPKKARIYNNYTLTDDGSDKP